MKPSIWTSLLLASLPVQTFGAIVIIEFGTEVPGGFLEWSEDDETTMTYIPHDTWEAGGFKVITLDPTKTYRVAPDGSPNQVFANWALPESDESPIEGALIVLRRADNGPFDLLSLQYSGFADSVEVRGWKTDPFPASYSSATPDVSTSFSAASNDEPPSALLTFSNFTGLQAVSFTAPDLVFLNLDKITVDAVPEPHEYLLAVGGGLLGFGLFRRLRRRGAGE